MIRTNKKAQEVKSKISMPMLSKKAQEEMVGFAIILVIVAVILLVVLGSSLRRSDREVLESYEVSGFIQSFLQYTTGCEGSRENFTVQKLIFECDVEAKCIDGRNSCSVLENTVDDMLKESWNVGEEFLVKGYELIILSNLGEIVNITEGERTNNYKGSSQDFSRSGSNVEILFTAYY